MHGRTRLIALTGTVAASLAFPVAAHAAIVKKVYEGLPTKDQKRFLAVPYEADAIDFFPHTVTIHVGDSVKFLPTAFHNVDIPAKTVRVQFDESRVDLEQIKAAVEDEEYPVAAVE